MNLELVTKFDKRNTTTSKIFDVEVVSTDYHVILIFPIDGWFGAIWNLDFGRIVYNYYIFIYTFSLKPLYLTKTENRTKKSPTQPSCYCFEERYYFCQKMLIFINFSKIKGILVLKGTIYETTYLCVLTYQILGF